MSISPAKTIPGVPESITRDAYIQLFEAAGIDPRQTRELSFKADGIHATVFAVDDEGKRILDPGVEGYVKHTIYIPVVEEEDAK
jgi:hypothetical protein